jgi:hypothetical protein
MRFGCGHPVDEPKSLLYLATVAVLARAGIAQLVEHDLAKVGVAGSNPVSRSTTCPEPAANPEEPS